MRILSLDYVVIIVMAIVLIVGAYQFYFWCQRQFIRPRKGLYTFVDSWFGYYPSWIWIYSGLYYPFIIFTTLTIRDMRHFSYTAFSYFILLGIQMIFFLIFPVQTPLKWRKVVSDNYISERFLRFVLKFDKDSNCFPSMHVSVAMLTALHIANNQPLFSPWVFSFPIIIALSSLYTKRHYFLDIIPGALLGLVVFKIYGLIYF